MTEQNSHKIKRPCEKLLWILVLQWKKLKPVDNIISFLAIFRYNLIVLKLPFLWKNFLALIKF